MSEEQNQPNREEQPDAMPEESQPIGYTVTPEGGFYTRKKEDIIQDTVEPEPQFSAEPQQNDNRGNFDPFTGTPRYAEAEFYRATPKPKKEKRRYGAGVIVTAVLLAAIIGTAGGFLSSRYFAESSATPSVGGTSPSNITIKVDETAESVVEAVAAKATSSVVGIRTTTSVTSFFGGSEESTGEGSGVVYSADGYIITNYHVVKSVAESGNGKIDVFFNSKDSDPYSATIVGYHIATDLALLKIKATGLPVVEIGNSDELKIGQQVVAIGSPGGLEFMGSVTSGYISGLNRIHSSSTGVKFIQTDAAINPGNSGGALLNAKGQLVGINRSKIVSTEYEAMGFAIPVNTVVEKVKKIIAKQSEPEPYVGISVSTRYTQEVLAYYGYPAGAVVLSVDEGSPAAQAGIRRGDIITEYDGTAIEDYSILNECISYSEPGSTVAVKIYRSGKYFSAKLKVASNGSNGR